MVKKKTPQSPPATLPRRVQTRERLLSAARQAIAEKGYNGTSLDSIAARAGLTKGAIYDNFAGKDELFLAVVGAWIEERSRRFNWPKGHSGTVKQRLRRFAAAVIADAPNAQLEAPMRAEFLLYTLTHEDMRKLVAQSTAARMALMREHVLAFLKESELPLQLDQFIVMLDALIPGLMFIRSQDASLVTDKVIIAIFESLAGKRAHADGATLSG